MTEHDKLVEGLADELIKVLDLPFLEVSVSLIIANWLIDNNLRLERRS